MIQSSEKSEWGSFALVSYIPDPQGTFLQSLRRLLPGDEHPQAHITILPPRPLKLPVEAASQQVQRILEDFGSFEVKLSEVRVFTETNVLYLDITDGLGPLYDLHRALNTAELVHVETFEFRPHLTLSGPVSAAQMDSVRRQAEKAWQLSGLQPQVTIDELVFLWNRPEGMGRQWERQGSLHLRTRDERAGKMARAGTNRTS